MKYFTTRKHNQKGYVLLPTIMLGLGIALLSITFLQTISTSSQNLNARTYQDLAQEAAQAGIAYVNGCVQSGISTWTAALGPKTDCNGAAQSTGTQYVYQQGAEWQSTFSVDANPVVSGGLLTATSRGTVQILNNGSVVSTYTSVSKTTLPAATIILPVASGTVLTDIKNDQSDCAIANGKLYCWGDNTYGQLGRGYTGNTPPGGNPSIATPTAVAGALAGKTVTKVSVAAKTVCAIADGTAYCWGDNTQSQLGDGTTTAKNVPTAGIPKTSSGPLSGKLVLDVETATENNPAGILDIYADGTPHTCALIADGSVACWGDGDFRQLTGRIGCGPFNLQQCYPSYSTPTLIEGYSNGSTVLAGVKAERLSVGTHSSCVAGQGNVYCVGLPIPLTLTCFVAFPAAAAGAASVLLLAPFYTPNSCTDTYTTGTNISSSSVGGDFVGKSADPNSWDMSTDAGCGMANTDFVCTGMSSAFGGWVFPGFSAPTTKISNADVTSHDNGDDTDTNGRYCVINAGVAQCTGTVYTGTGYVGQNNWRSLVTSSGLAGKSPTKIAAGYYHGCVIANGQLLCWGNGSSGTLADGNPNNHTVNYATVTGNSTIGTATGTYAAHSSISTGGGFSCGIVNGNAYCWGNNANGQLGTGNTINSLQPRAVSSLASSVATKVSAGNGHACAIVTGSVWCWGDNTYGQIGNGASGGNVLVPYQIGGVLAGKRVTDISAGYDSTCAVANGQLYCWGDSAYNKTGTGNLTATPTPVTTPTIVNGKGVLATSLNVTAVTVGTNHACAIANADAYCWGDNTYGELGIGSTSGTPSAPVLVNKGTAASPTGPNSMRPSVTGLSAGSNFTCGIFNAIASCWGNNANGRTGLNIIANTNTTSPTALSGAAGGYYATAISAGSGHACAILNGNSSNTNGNLYCWGTGTGGRVGNNSTSDVAVATVITGGDNSGKSATAIGAGLDSTCDIANGDIQCWGNGASGQIGNGNISSVLVPTITTSYVQAGNYTQGVMF